MSLNKVGEMELLFYTFGSKVPIRIKCAAVQMKIREILDKDEVIIEALESDEVTSAPLEFAPIDIMNELTMKGINLYDVDYGVFGNENISLIIGADHYFNIVSGEMKRLNPKLVAIESKFGWLLSAVIFLRKMEKDIISVSFACAKSRVAPLRQTTIPRLEILACCIGARLSTVVIKAIGLENIPVFYWSDYLTALYWIERNEN
ncbi:integrase_H2C2 domain-containing protein [Nephila pilipes]|uniref:Integrase_H2C2 domain-containing protein n=1 Tax=Nephila pilipes TaxID=299642 RepID=A0A8X6MNW7_NEPPI|nr:integrase_H2C2 domain-containing protein [Nephila pilipes]